MAKGGNTATAIKPAGTKATADAADGLPATLGDPPPPGDPGVGEPGGAPPASIAGRAGIISIMVTATVTAATAAERTESKSNGTFQFVKNPRITHALCSRNFQNVKLRLVFVKI